MSCLIAEHGARLLTMSRCSRSSPSSIASSRRPVDRRLYVRGRRQSMHQGRPGNKDRGRPSRPASYSMRAWSLWRRRSGSPVWSVSLWPQFG